jgi:hypothetical protein
MRRVDVEGRRSMCLLLKVGDRGSSGNPGD